VLQLAHALIVAQILNISKISVFHRMVLLNRRFMTSIGVEIVIGHVNHMRPYAISSSFWGLPDPEVCDPRLLPATVALFKDEFLLRLPQVNVSESTLFAHVRSGDLFSEISRTEWTKLCGQPFCNYYLEAMRRDVGHKDVQVLSEDRRNPCVDIMIQNGAKFFDHSRFIFDLALMIYARRIIWSVSTISKSVMLLSPVKKVFYTFNEFTGNGSKGRLYRFWRFGPHEHCVPSKNYTRNVLSSNWMILPEQLELMKKENCSEWVTLPRPNKWNW
jgi:hypothetical protein